jgi:hypothetical protein
MNDIHRVESPKSSICMKQRDDTIWAQCRALNALVFLYRDVSAQSAVISPLDQLAVGASSGPT